MVRGDKGVLEVHEKSFFMPELPAEDDFVGWQTFCCGVARRVQDVGLEKVHQETKGMSAEIEHCTREQAKYAADWL
ncbi:MAG: hypothetical protein ABIG60_04200 [Patescibacteria group bacterium]